MATNPTEFGWDLHLIHSFDFAAPLILPLVIDSSQTISHPNIINHILMLSFLFSNAVTDLSSTEDCTKIGQDFEVWYYKSGLHPNT